MWSSRGRPRKVTLNDGEIFVVQSEEHFHTVCRLRFLPCLGSRHGHSSSCNCTDHPETLAQCDTYLQPFLTLVPPSERDAIVALTAPFSYVLGVIRTICILSLGLVYSLLVHGLCSVLVRLASRFRQSSRLTVTDAYPCTIRNHNGCNNIGHCSVGSTTGGYPVVAR